MIECCVKLVLHLLARFVVATSIQLWCTKNIYACTRRSVHNAATNKRWQQWIWNGRLFWWCLVDHAVIDFLYGHWLQTLTLESTIVMFILFRLFLVAQYSRGCGTNNSTLLFFMCHDVGLELYVSITLQSHYFLLIYVIFSSFCMIYCTW